MHSTSLLSHPFHQEILDAIPSPIFLVDDDVRIYEYNDAAAELLNAPAEAVLMQKGGNILSCINSTRKPGGCGKEAECQKCAIRNSVTSALSGHNVVQKKHHFIQQNNEKLENHYFLITTSPCKVEDKEFVVLVIEDITQFEQLKKFIPICASCKKIRRDDQFWTEMETFFHDDMDIEFSHGLCPSCADVERERMTKDLENYKPKG